MSVVRGLWTLSPLPDEGRVRRSIILRDGRRLSHRRWIEMLREDADARSVLTEALRESTFRAYLWETPVVVPGDQLIQAEMALTESSALEHVAPDPSAFAAAFATNGRIATFANLGRDAVLVAPNPTLAPHSAHLAAFVRSAPEEVVDGLWIAVATAVSEWLARRGRPVWVSTSGLAVPWLHVRLDSVPKYYSYRSYRNVPGA